MAKLKPCPFCGRAAIIEQLSPRRCAVGCPSAECGVQPLVIHSAEAGACEMWNQRAEEGANGHKPQNPA